MKLLTSTAVLLAAAVASAAPPASDPSTSARSEFTVATREIQVDGHLYQGANDIAGELAGPLAEAVEYHLAGAAVAPIRSPMALNAIGDVPESFFSGKIMLSVDTNGVGPNSSTIRFTVDFSHLDTREDAPLIGKAGLFADELAEGFRKNLADSLHRFQFAEQEDLQAGQKILARMADKYEQAQMRERAIRDDLRHETQRTDLSDSAFKEAISSLETERQKLELDVAGMKARRDALDQAVAEQSKRSVDAADKDPVAAELAKLVDIREKQLTMVKQMQEKGVGSPVDVQNAEAAAAEARARLAERKLAAAGPTDVLFSWNKQLLDLTVDLREKEARLQAIVQMLNNFSGAVEKAQALEMARRVAVQAGVEVEKARDELEKVRDTGDFTPPKVTITPIQSSPAVSN